jgi:hypothetical protein
VVKAGNTLLISYILFLLHETGEGKIIGRGKTLKNADLDFEPENEARNSK